LAAEPVGKAPAVRSLESALEALKHGYPAHLNRYLNPPVCAECDRLGCAGVEHDVHARVGYAISAIEMALAKLAASALRQ
jgi:hypothetical protein